MRSETASQYRRKLLATLAVFQAKNLFETRRGASLCGKTNKTGNEVTGLWVFYTEHSSTVNAHSNDG